MFVPHDKNVSRRFFQRPNILRKNPRPVLNSKLTEGTQIQISVASSRAQLSIQEHNSEKITNHKCSKQIHGVKKPSQWVLVNNYICDDHISNNTIESSTDTNEVTLPNLKEACENSVGFMYHSTGEKYLNEGVDHYSLQIRNTVMETNEVQVTSVGNSANGAMSSYVIFDNSNKGVESYNDNAKDLTTSHIQEVKSVVGENIVLPNEVTDTCIGSNKQIVQGAIAAKQSHMISNGTGSFKCDVVDCNKLFDSEEKLQKHKSSHNKRSGQRSLKQAVECPVKSMGATKDQSCGRIYLNREELMKHLNEDHTIDEASHKCELCDRRFFWLTGLRAHGRSHTNNRARKHVCPWPDCGRAFMQACRLKEHTRAHTGDRPYSCQYPDCGWSFRTASKLVRHARQHSGERRHVCAECGRRFLRAEHLRDHVLRHAHPQLRPRHACNVHGCEQSFINMSSLYHHVRKVHQKGENKSEDTTVELTFPVDSDPDWTIIDNSFSLSNEDDASGPEWHSARTHCTWPLAPIPQSVTEPPATSPGENAEGNGDTTGAAYTVDNNDVQVELFENSDSNIYTVRSDLFLHANAIHSEDSEGCEDLSDVCEDGLELVLLPPPSTLDLDPPPSHLMQEELMYADAVDESSFQVLLLNGDEIN